MDVVRLSADDCNLLGARFGEHGNSHRRMTSALQEACADDAVERLRALRGLEVHFKVDLGSLCHRFLHRDDDATHPLERTILNYIASVQLGRDGQNELFVLVDRVREVRDLIEGELVREPES